MEVEGAQQACSKKHGLLFRRGEGMKEKVAWRQVTLVVYETLKEPLHTLSWQSAEEYTLTVLFTSITFWHVYIRLIFLY